MDIALREVFEAVAEADDFESVVDAFDGGGGDDAVDARGRAATDQNAQSAFVAHKFAAECHAPEKIQFHSCQKPTTICQMNRAVFLDRDGTMIAEKNYLCRPEDVEIFPATPAGLKRLADADFKLFIVSNQSGVGRGYFTMADVERVNAPFVPRTGARRRPV